MSVQEQVENKIKYLVKGQPFAIDQFYSIGSESSVQQSLSRLVKRGVIKRIERGIYFRPKYHSYIASLELPANAEDVARVWARKNKFTLVTQGMEEAYKLGLQTQAPIKRIFWTDGPTRTFESGNQVVEVRHVSSYLLKWHNTNQGRLLRALSVFKDYEVSTKSLENIWRRLSVSNEQGAGMLANLKNSVGARKFLPQSIINSDQGIY